MGLKLNLSSNNEIIVPLDFKIPEADYDNLKAEKPLKAVLRKVNGFILQDKSFETSISEDGSVGVTLNKLKYIKQVFVRFEDPLSMSLDGGPEKDVTLEDTIYYSEFTGLLTALFTEASKVLTHGKEAGKKVDETKKS